MTGNEPVIDKYPLLYIDMNKGLLDKLLRVDQAGEMAAKRIYAGQMAVLGRDPKMRPLLLHMAEQEEKHLTHFNQLMQTHRIRPTFMMPIWHTAAYMLGVTTAMMGREAAMACTEAVEQVVGEHYNDQLRDIYQSHPEWDKCQALKQVEQVIKEARDEELEHLQTAQVHGAHRAPFYHILSSVIKTGCRAAISITKRI